MPHHGKHRAGLATEVPQNAAADLGRASSEGELAAEESAQTERQTSVGTAQEERANREHPNGLPSPDELNARDDQGPSTANPAIGADPDLATDSDDGAAPADAEAPSEADSPSEAQQADADPEDAAPTAAQEQGWMR